MIGVDDSRAPGIFSLCKESEFMPFLTNVEDLPQNLHYFMTSTEGKKTTTEANERMKMKRIEI